jgi:aspartate racemase
LLECIEEEVRARALKRVALFGTRFTIETRLFGQLEGVEIITPKPEEVDTIHHTYFELASDGKGAEEHHRTLTALAHTLLEREGLDAILLAGTDLSLVFNESNTDFPHVDCARVHIRSILRSLQ